MGTDISFLIEQHFDPGERWVLAKHPRSSYRLCYEDRNYELFSLLTGLDFSARLLRPIVPIAPLRDWPADLSDQAEAALLSSSDDTAFGRSWLDAADFAAYDWDATLTWTFMASPPPGLRVTDKIRSQVRSHLEEHRELPVGWRIAAWSRDGFEVTVPTTPRERAGQFIEVAEDMAKLAAENLTRCDASLSSPGKPRHR